MSNDKLKAMTTYAKIYINTNGNQQKLWFLLGVCDEPEKNENFVNSQISHCQIRKIYVN